MGLAMTRIVHRTWTAASATATETTPLFNVKKNDRVLWASAMPSINASVGAVGTASLGDTGGVASLIAAFTPTLAASPVATPINGAGAYLANSGGYLVLADGTIDVVFTYVSGGVIKPSIKFTIAIARDTN